MGAAAAAAVLFARFPDVDTAYVCGDEQAFASLNLATLHEATIGEDPPTEVLRADVPDEISAELALMAQTAGLAYAKAGVPGAAADAAAESLEDQMDAIAVALGADDLTGIADPVVLSGDITITRNRAVLGAWQRFGQTAEDWNLMDNASKEALVLNHINTLNL